MKHNDNRLAMLFDEAIGILQEFEPPEGYYVAFSGGKDSIVILDLVRRAGVKHDAHFNITSVDPPELINFINEHYKDVEKHRPEMTMFQLIEKKNILPTCKSRFCCGILKERGGTNRFVVTGIRKAESARRSKRQMFEISKTDKTKRMIHIIIDWTDKDVWDYIRKLKLPYPVLYDQGWKRIGCIGCCMCGKKEKERQFNLYPNHKLAYMNTIKKMVEKQPRATFGNDYQMFFEWWLSGLSLKKFFGQKEQIEIKFNSEE